MEKTAYYLRTVGALLTTLGDDAPAAYEEARDAAAAADSPADDENPAGDDEAEEDDEEVLSITIEGEDEPEISIDGE